MSLQLDARQRAMLAEMHIRVWQPQSEAQAVHAAAATIPADSAPDKDRSMLASTPTAPAPQAAAAAPSAPAVIAAPLAPLRTPALARPVAGTTQAASDDVPAQLPDGVALQAQQERVAHLGWGELQAAVQQCQACALGQTRAQAVWGQPDVLQANQTAHADWLVVVAAPSGADAAQGQPMVGEAGQLLDNILAAVGLQRAGLGPLGHSVFITPAIKCAPPQERNPQAQEVDMCEPHLARQIALLQPKVIVAMGLVAAQSVLRHDATARANLPLGRLRAQVWQHQGIPVVVTYPSAYLMRNPADKARAWADWCMARTLALGQTG